MAEPDQQHGAWAARLHNALEAAGYDELGHLKSCMEQYGIPFDPAPLVRVIEASPTDEADVCLQTAFAQWNSLLCREMNRLELSRLQLEEEKDGVTNSLTFQRQRCNELATENTALKDDLKTVRTELRETSALNRKLIDRASNAAANAGSQVPHHAAAIRRVTQDPEKFDGLEKDVAKRQDQYTTWRTRITLNFAEDTMYFHNEPKKILCILRCLGGDVYTLNQELLDQIETHPNDPSTWKYATAADLIAELNRQYETLDLVHDATIKFDTLEQGHKPFQNFLAAFVALASKCRKTEEQKVEALKRKVSKEIAGMLKTLASPPKRDDFKAWADQCQVFYNNLTEYDHNQKLKPAPQRNNNTLTNRGGGTNQNQGRHSHGTDTAGLSAVPATTAVTAHVADDPMQLDAMRTAERELLYAQGLCFYCKEPGHVAEHCAKKKAADARRELLRGGGRGGRGGRGSFFGGRSRGRGGFGGAVHYRRIAATVEGGGFVEGEVDTRAQSPSQEKE